MGKIQTFKILRSSLWKVPKREINADTLRYIHPKKISPSSDEFIQTTQKNFSTIPNKSHITECPKELKFLKKVNPIILRPQISKALSQNFALKKQQLLNNFRGKEDFELYEKINSAQTADELSVILEKAQTELLLRTGAAKKRLLETTDKANIEKLRKVYLKYYYDFTQTAIKIQKGLVSKSATPEAIKIEEQLKSYGVDFVAIGDDIKKGRLLLKTCKIWQKSGNKIPNGIIISDTMPISVASGQCLRDLNGETIVLLRPSSNKLMNWGDCLDRLQAKFASWFKYPKICNKSTASKFHVPIHEFSHSVQSQNLVELRVKIPEQYKTVASKVSQYGNGSLEELFAELNTKAVLASRKMSEDEWQLLEYMQKA